jgi:hypothetical protein
MTKFDILQSKMMHIKTKIFPNCKTFDIFQKIADILTVDNVLKYRYLLHYTRLG